MLDRLAADLSSLRRADQFRTLACPSGIQLGSNDYLGLSTHPALKEAVATALEHDLRFASTGSRLLSGNHERWEQLESEFAGILGTEAALFFPTGYMANIGLLSSILKPEDTVFSDAANHASLIDGIRLSQARKAVVPHLDLNYLEHALRQEKNGGQKIVVLEGIFSMEGDRASVRDLLSLCDRFDAYLILDEAHSFGVDGSEGRGLANAIGRTDRILATVHPCGKAIASFGAFVAGSEVLRDFLINRARSFMFTTALPPYCAGHVRKALELALGAEMERAHLRQLGDYLRHRMRAAGFDIGRSDSQIVPLVLGSNEAAVRFATALVEAGFAVRPIRPPTVPLGTARLRLSLNAGLSKEDIDALVSTIIEIRETEVVPE
jgi:8-amino-7-oxononanoate synthase